MDSIWTRIEKLPSFPKLQGDTKTLVTKTKETAKKWWKIIKDGGGKK